MKKTLLLSLFLAGAMSAFAQGTVTFSNTAAFTTAGDRNVYNVDGVTGLSGSTWSAQLYWGLGSGLDASSLSAVDASPRTFLTGSSAGKWAPATKTFSGAVAGNTVTLQVRAWDNTGGATWDTSTIRGASTTFNYTIPAAGSPAAAFFMEGLQSFSVAVVPEPSTIALGVLGAGALLMVRRRK